MRIHLEQLPHQEEAVEKILEEFDNLIIEESNVVYENPKILPNPSANRTATAFNPPNIDVKMETGTGKTYVYTRLMHELYKRSKIFKFIIITPSLAIKEGTKNFIISEYANQHFNELFTGQRINLSIINSGDFSLTKGRKSLSGSLLEFTESSKHDQNTICCLLINDAMLGSKSMTRDDYDQTLFNAISRPIDALKGTKPIVIIDEPHRFKKSGTAWQNILSLDPQMIIRFGATFPKIETGKDKGKTDYANLVYDLNAVQSFNQGLVKAVDIDYPDLTAEQQNKKFKVTSVKKNEVEFSSGSKSFKVSAGEDLGTALDSDFGSGLTYEGVDNKLSNDLELQRGMVLIPGVFSNTYQELLLSQAINSHFEKEEDNFFRENAGEGAPRIKTLSLFFIDSIESFRGKNGENDGWLHLKFEELIKEKLNELIKKYVGTKNSKEAEYLDFLKASKYNIKETMAGYFSEDSGKKGDEAISAEVDDILRNKERLLSFKDGNGNWNVRRFLFSKWTLREGWDNPNVFVICKLRTSGSEISKIQEVGRGLRLPVDERGNRLSEEEFRLDFLIDYSEKDFAEKLVGEVNSDSGKMILDREKISSAMIDLISKIINKDHDTVVNDLGAKGIIDFNKNFLENVDIDGAKKHGYDHLIEMYPELLDFEVKGGKIRNKVRNKPQIKLNKKNWEKVRDLWDEVSRRYMLVYKGLDKEELTELINSSVKDAFCEQRGKVKRFETVIDANTNELALVEREIELKQIVPSLKYGEFLIKLHEKTCVEVNDWHKAIVIELGKDGKDVGTKFNEMSLSNIYVNFQSNFIKKYKEKFDYEPLDFKATVSLYDENGKLKESLDQGVVGTTKYGGKVPENYLWDFFAGDSMIEHDVLMRRPEESIKEKIVVFGKMPRRSVKVPTYTGGTSSPDFMYAFKKNDGTMGLKLLIETKDKPFEAFWDTEVVAIESQAKMSEILKDKGIEIRLAKSVDDVVNFLYEFSGTSGKS